MLSCPRSRLLKLTMNQMKSKLMTTLMTTTKPSPATMDAPLLSALKAKRRFLAEQADVPAYIVFNDKTLIEMAQKRPKNFDEMAKINGIGSKKLDTYGAAFLEPDLHAAI